MGSHFISQDYTQTVSKDSLQILRYIEIIMGAH